MCKGHLFALPAVVGISVSFLLEEAGWWHKHELGRGSGRVRSSAMVSIRACRGMKGFRWTHPESLKPQVKSASEGLFTAMYLGCVLPWHRHNLPGRELPSVSPQAASALSSPAGCLGKAVSGSGRGSGRVTGMCQISSCSFGPHSYISSYSMSCQISCICHCSKHQHALQ